MQDTQARELSFVIPTHRLREVGATIEDYDEHLWRNGHSVRLAVFDDSSPVNQQKYYPPLEQTRTHQPIYYVGPAEKEQFLAYLNSRLRDRRLETLVSNLFRPSYGGNRNCTLMYTLDGLMISSDDDMRPYSFVEYSPDVLGKRGGDVPDNYERGEFLIDTAMDLETNATKGLARENSLFLKRGTVPESSTVKIAQTFRSGTNDIDALDFLEMFLKDEEQSGLDDLNEKYVLVNFRPAVTKRNWRMDCGVAGYDNSFGLPPFFPHSPAI
jgi:hypothetical protein